MAGAHTHTLMEDEAHRFIEILSLTITWFLAVSYIYNCPGVDSVVRAWSGMRLLCVAETIAETFSTYTNVFTTERHIYERRGACFE